jgi:hypothetical protein
MIARADFVKVVARCQLFGIVQPSHMKAQQPLGLSGDFGTNHASHFDTLDRNCHRPRVLRMPMVESSA